MWWVLIQLARFGRRRRDPEFEDTPPRSARLPRVRRRIALPQR